jgi:hypothetical protein
MRRKFSLILTLAAWLLATGSHWDLVQTFGWGRMIATYSQSMSFAQAVKKNLQRRRDLRRVRRRRHRQATGRRRCLSADRPRQILRQNTPRFRAGLHARAADSSCSFPVVA